MKEESLKIDGINLAKLRPTYGRGMIAFMIPLLLAFISHFLFFYQSNLLLKITGLFINTIATWHWFSVVHSAGHGAMFPSRMGNDLAGTIGQCLGFLPYFSWRRLHYLHHQHNGQGELDPTRVNTTPEEMKPASKAIINFLWKYHIPLFGVMFVTKTFLYLPNSLPYARNTKEKWLMASSTFCVIGFQVLMSFLINPYYFGFTMLSLAIFGFYGDPILLGQHCYLPKLEIGSRSLSAMEQDQLTRTITFGEWVDRFVFAEFNNHSSHHIYPSIPHYNVYRMNHLPCSWKENGFKWWAWARSKSAVELIFGQPQ